MNEFVRFLDAYRRFAPSGLTENLSRIEGQLEGASRGELDAALKSIGATDNALRAALELKNIVGQIHVAIHALGILLCLPMILEPGEIVEGLSLGAGNTGRDFDLETNRRVAEFKFIAWKGGSETIRQNSVFKDFFLLAEHPTQKQKYLYLVGVEPALRFLRGNRALRSVLKDARLAKTFGDLYADQYKVVRDYFEDRRDSIQIEDIAGLLPNIFLETLETAGSSEDPDTEASDPGDPEAPVLSLPLRATFERFHDTEHVTANRQILYKVEVAENGLIFTPETTGKPRRETWLRVGRVLRRFGVSRSTRPVDYTDLTRNSSYLLPLIGSLERF